MLGELRLPSAKVMSSAVQPNRALTILATAAVWMLCTRAAAAAYHPQGLLQPQTNWLLGAQRHLLQVRRRLEQRWLNGVGWRS